MQFVSALARGKSLLPYPKCAIFAPLRGYELFYHLASSSLYSLTKLQTTQYNLARPTVRSVRYKHFGVGGLLCQNHREESTYVFIYGRDGCYPYN